MLFRFKRRPNVARLARRGNVDGLIAALTYRQMLTSRGRQFDLGAPIRAEAVRALRQIDDPSASRALAEVAVPDTDPRVRTLAILALDGSTDLELLTALVDGVCTWHERVYGAARDAAIEHLRHVRTGLAPALVRALVNQNHSNGLGEDEKWILREVIAPDEQKRQASASMLVRLMGSDREATAQRAEDAIVELAPCGTSELIHALLDPSLAPRAAGALARRRDGRAVKPLLQSLQAGSPATRKAAAVALGELRDPMAAQALFAAANDADDEVRVAAAGALEKLGAIAVIASALDAVVDHRQRLVREAGHRLSHENRSLQAGVREAFRRGSGEYHSLRTAVREAFRRGSGEHGSLRAGVREALREIQRLRGRRRAELPLPALPLSSLLEQEQEPGLD